MEKQIIEKYIKTKCSIEQLCKEFKVGKNKIKEILQQNNIPLNKRGGQIKNVSIKKITVDKNENKIISCKKCNKHYNDIENKSGAITEHIKLCSPEVIIPSKYKRNVYKNINGIYWHYQFFDLIDKQPIDKINCPMCDWKSSDITNKTGSLTKHIVKNHCSIDEFIENHKDYEKFFNKHIEHLNTINSFDDENNFVVCKICDEAFKTITNTHLKIHNITTDEYKTQYGENSLLSLSSKTLFINNIKDVNNVFVKRSKGEIEIETFLKENDVNVEVCNKNILSGVELDIYLPDYKIAIEYNGLYWHSEKQGKTKTYHINKTKKCIEKNIHLIHIFSDDWLKKKHIIKNRILNLLRKNENKIQARKCEIVNLTKSEKKEFLNLNHLQGNDKSSIYIGLKYNNNIVSVMTFGKMRNSLGNKNKNQDEYELYRFASLNVIGGFTKLLSHFIKTIRPQKILTYADRNWSPSIDMCFYGNVGFNYIGETKPNYTYTKKYDKREHRFNFRKDVLIKLGYDKNKSETQIMIENGYDKIWDTGSLKYEMILNKKNP